LRGLLLVGLPRAGRAEVALEGVEQRRDLGVAAARGVQLELLDGLGAVLFLVVRFFVSAAGASERRHDT